MPIAARFTFFKFRKNLGQWDEEVLFRCSVNGVVLSFLEDELSFCTGREIHVSDEKEEMTFLEATEEHEYLVWNMEFLGSKQHTRITASGKTNSRTNYLVGNDRTKWVINVLTMIR